MKPKRTRSRHGQNAVQYLDRFDQWRVGGGVVLQVNHPLDGGEIPKLNGLDPNLEAGGRVPVARFPQQTLRIQGLLASLAFPAPRQGRARLPAVKERKPIRIVPEALRPRQILQPQLAAVFKNHGGLRPERLVPAAPVAPVPDADLELRRPAQRRVEAHRAVLEPQDRRREQLPAARENMERHRPIAQRGAAPRVVVVLEPDLGDKPGSRLAESDQDMLGRVERDAVRVDFCAELVRGSPPGLTPRDPLRNILEQKLQTRSVAGAWGNTQEPVRPLPAGKEFARLGGRHRRHG